jgi:hypothetical protein
MYGASMTGRAHSFPAAPRELSWPADKNGKPLRKADHGYTLAEDPEGTALVSRNGRQLGLYTSEPEGPGRVTLSLTRDLSNV